MARKKSLPPVTEAAFQEMVIAYARLQGWACVHFRGVRIQRADGTVYYATPVQADGDGWLDLVLVRERLLVVELKAERGRLTAAQRAWVCRLRDAGQEVHVWKPSQWNEIERVLGR